MASCARHSQRSYSDHDPQKRGAARFDRDDIDDGSFGMGVRFQPGQCPAGRGRASGALLVIHLCVWLLHPDGVLFRVPSSAKVVGILAGTALTITATRRRLEQPQWFLEVQLQTSIFRPQWWLLGSAPGFPPAPS